MNTLMQTTTNTTPQEINFPTKPDLAAYKLLADQIRDADQKQFEEIVSSTSNREGGRRYWLGLPCGKKFELFTAAEPEPDLDTAWSFVLTVDGVREDACYGIDDYEYAATEGLSSLKQSLLEYLDDCANKGTITPHMTAEEFVCRIIEADNFVEAHHLVDRLRSGLVEVIGYGD